jgi:hypothetical protein
MSVLKFKNASSRQLNEGVGQKLYLVFVVPGMELEGRRERAKFKIEVARCFTTEKKAVDFAVKVIYDAVVEDQDESEPDVKRYLRKLKKATKLQQIKDLDVDEIGYESEGFDFAVVTVK